MMSLGTTTARMVVDAMHCMYRYDFSGGTTVGCGFGLPKIASTVCTVLCHHRHSDKLTEINRTSGTQRIVPYEFISMNVLTYSITSYVRSHEQ